MVNRQNFFFLAGAQRCGTSWLYRMLDKHPEIEMAKPIFPEPKFFLNDEEASKGMEYYQNKYFSKKSVKISGEKGTSYIEFPEKMSRAKKLFPNIKILISLRNPINRAISNYKFSRENGLETRSPEQVFLKNFDQPEIDFETSVNPFDYIKRGQYVEYIENLENFFSPNEMLFLFMEDLTTDISYLQDVYRFLGVNENFSPDSFNFRSNESSSGNSDDFSKIIDFLSEHYKPYNERLMQKVGRLPW